MDSETNHNNHIENHQEVENNVNQDPQNQEPNLELPPLLREYMPGFDEFREAINELLQEERARALPRNAPPVQPPDGTRRASTTNGHPDPVPPQGHAAEDRNLGFNPNAATNGNHNGTIANPGK